MAAEHEQFEDVSVILMQFEHISVIMIFMRTVGVMVVVTDMLFPLVAMMTAALVSLMLPFVENCSLSL